MAELERKGELELERKRELEREWKEVQTVLEKLNSQIKYLQKTAFQLANFYFASQAVVFTAITGGASSLACNDVWFPLALSLLPGALNLYALLTIGNDYITAIMLRSQNTCRKDDLGERMAPQSIGFQQAALAQMSPNDRVAAETAWADANNRADGALRKSLERNRNISMIAFAFFAIVIAFGSVWMLCGQTEFLKHLDDQDKCVKLCERSKCIRICPDS